jgi:hypothetical protein
MIGKKPEPSPESTKRISYIDTGEASRRKNPVRFFPHGIEKTVHCLEGGRPVSFIEKTGDPFVS